MKLHGIAKAAVSSKHLPNTNPVLHRKALSQQAAAPPVCPQAAPEPCGVRGLPGVAMQPLSHTRQPPRAAGTRCVAGSS